MTEERVGEDPRGDPAAEAGAPDSESGGPEPAAPKKPGPVRRLYDWVLHWADTPYGEPALAGIAAAESSVFPIPPDPLIVALALGKPRRSLRFALIATVASVVGGIIGYLIGAFGWELMGGFFFEYVPGVTPEAFLEVEGFFQRWGFWAVFLAGLTPIPYKVFTLSSGVFAVNFPVFVLASFLSRGLRFFIVAGLIYKFGRPIAAFIDRYFNLLMWVFGALLLGGFLVIEMVL